MAYSTMYNVFDRFRPAPNLAQALAPYSTPGGFNPIGQSFVNPNLTGLAPSTTPALPDIGAAYAARQAAAAAAPEAGLLSRLPGMLGNAAKGTLGQSLGGPAAADAGRFAKMAHGAPLQGLAVGAGGMGLNALGQNLIERSGGGQANEGTGLQGLAGRLSSAAGTGTQLGAIGGPIAGLVGGAGTLAGQLGVEALNLIPGYDESHGTVTEAIGKLPLLGGFVGKTEAPAPAPELTDAQGIHNKIAEALPDPTIREAFIKSYNEDMAMRRQAGMSPEQAARVTYDEAFGTVDPQTGAITPGKLAAVAQQAPSAQDAQTAVALQALYADMAQRFGGNAQASLVPYNAAMSNVIPQLPAWLAPIAQASQAQSNLDTANQVAAQQAYFQSLPGQIAAQQQQDLQNRIASRLLSQQAAAAAPNQAAASSNPLSAIPGLG